MRTKIIKLHDNDVPCGEGFEVRELAAELFHLRVHQDGQYRLGRTSVCYYLRSLDRNFMNGPFRTSIRGFSKFKAFINSAIGRNPQRESTTTCFAKNSPFGGFVTTCRGSCLLHLNRKISPCDSRGIRSMSMTSSNFTPFTPTFSTSSVKTPGSLSIKHQSPMVLVAEVFLRGE